MGTKVILEIAVSEGDFDQERFHQDLEIFKVSRGFMSQSNVGSRLDANCLDFSEI